MRDARQPSSNDRQQVEYTCLISATVVAEPTRPSTIWCTSTDVLFANCDARQLARSLSSLSSLAASDPPRSREDRHVTGDHRLYGTHLAG
jgi:hypothetical protein